MSAEEERVGMTKRYFEVKFVVCARCLYMMCICVRMWLWCVFVDIRVSLSAYGNEIFEGSVCVVCVCGVCAWCVYVCAWCAVCARWAVCVWCGVRVWVHFACNLYLSPSEKTATSTTLARTLSTTG